MTDGDGVKVKGYVVRLAGLDAPEWNQKAKNRFGFWFNHGKRVKRALTCELAGRDIAERVLSATALNNVVEDPDSNMNNPVDPLPFRIQGA